MTKSGQTVNYSAKDHLADIEKYIGRPIDSIIIHKGMIDEHIVEWYVSHNEQRVIDDLGNDKRVVRADIADNTPVQHNKADKIASYARSILRHEGNRLAKVVVQLL